jgi:hypothetical protein
MTSTTKIALTAVAAAFFAAASPGARADAHTLPTFGHYIGYATVASPSSACPNKAGDHFTLQLELNTVHDLPVFLTRHVNYNATTGAPVLYKTAYNRKSGTKLAPSGTITVTDENTSKAVNGTYSAIYTPFDPNSFGGTIHVSYLTSTGTCTVTREVVFVRSSAD